MALGHLSTFNIYGGVGGSGGIGGQQGGPGGFGGGPRFSGNFSHANFFTGHLLGAAGIHILHFAAALEALEDFADSEPQPRCHAGTRVELIDNLSRWATDVHPPQEPVCWLYGPAGAGKTAVMHSLCQRLQEDGKTWAAFFFKRGHTTRGSAGALFVTLAYQLALNAPDLKTLISQIVEQDPSLTRRSLPVQLQRLIIEPCNLLQNPTPITLLIDGLDECEPVSAQQVLSLIGGVSNELNSGLRFLVSSRLEPRIHESFERDGFMHKLRRTDIGKSFEDVRKYLGAEFARIYETRMPDVPVPWPRPGVLEALVEKSSGYFIYAATVVAFVDDEFADPSERVEVLQTLKPVPLGDTPFMALDQLYTQILTAVPRRLHVKLRDVLCVIVNFGFDLSATAVGALLNLGDDITFIMRGLHSIVYSIGDRCAPHHASFREFLEDSQRSSIFYIGSCIDVVWAVLEAFSTPLSTRLRADAFQRAAGQIHALDFFWYLVSNPPSAIPNSLIRDLNPDRFPWGLGIQDCAQSLIPWLKKMSPRPDKLIQLWEDYCLMDSFMNSKDLRSPQGSPLAKIFQAADILSKFSYHYNARIDLRAIRILLDLSWDELRSAICSGMPHSVISVPSSAEVAGDLACGCLRMIQVLPEESKIEKTHQVLVNYMMFGYFVRMSPPESLGLLRALQDFVPPWDLCSDNFQTPVEFHDVLQWLKAHRDPPDSLISQWTGYLEHVKSLGNSFKTGEDLDGRWNFFHRPSSILKKRPEKAQTTPVWKLGWNPRKQEDDSDLDEAEVPVDAAVTENPHGGPERTEPGLEIEEVAVQL